MVMPKAGKRWYVQIENPDTPHWRAHGRVGKWRTRGNENGYDTRDEAIDAAIEVTRDADSGEKVAVLLVTVYYTRTVVNQTT